MFVTTFLLQTNTDEKNYMVIIMKMKNKILPLAIGTVFTAASQAVLADLPSNAKLAFDDGNFQRIDHLECADMGEPHGSAARQNQADFGTLQRLTV